MPFLNWVSDEINKTMASNLNERNGRDEFILLLNVVVNGKRRDVSICIVNSSLVILIYIGDWKVISRLFS